MNTIRTLQLAGVFLLLGYSACLNTSPPATNDQSIEQSTHSISNGTPISDLLQLTVTPQGIAIAACSAVIYNANWAIGSADCIAPARDTNEDGLLVGTEIPAGSMIWNGPPTGVNPIDLVVKHPEAIFGSNSGTDLVMYHVSTPFDIPWLIANRGAVNFFTDNALNLYSSSTKLPAGSQILAYGYGDPTFPQLGAGYPEMVTDYGSWYVTQAVNGKGGTCLGDAGGPDFFWDGTKYNWFGLHATYSGICGVGGESNVASRYVATWIQHIAGTLR